MMSKSLNEVEKQVHVAEVVHHGEKLTIPVGMGVQDAIDLLERRRDYLSEKVIIRREFNVFPWDGANALAQALTNRFGRCRSPPCCRPAGRHHPGSDRRSSEAREAGAAPAAAAGNQSRERVRYCRSACSRNHAEPD